MTDRRDDVRLPISRRFRIADKILVVLRSARARRITPEQLPWDRRATRPSSEVYIDATDMLENITVIVKASTMVSVMAWVRSECWILV